MDFIIIAFALSALVWLPIILVRLNMLAGGLIFLLLANCCGVELMKLDIGPFNMALDRFFLLALAAAYAVQWSLDKFQQRPLAWADGIFLALVGWVTFSTFTHDWRGASLGEIQVVQHLINGYLTPLAIYWIVRQSTVTERGLVSTYMAMVLFGVYLAITGILEVHQQWSFVFPGYIADPKVSIHFGRAHGPMVHGVTYGMTLAVCCVCGWALWPRLKSFGRGALLALAPVAAAALFYSYTRSAWLGSALALATCISLTLPRRWSFGVLGTLATAGLLVAITNFERIIAFDRTDNTAAQTEESVGLRGSFAYVSWQMFQDHPITGVGFGQFPREKLPYLADRTTPLRLEAIRPMVHHNTYLSLLTELGIVGLGLFLALIAAWAHGAWKLFRSGSRQTSELTRSGSRQTSDRTSADFRYTTRIQGVVMLAILAVYIVQCLFHEMTFSVRDPALVCFFAGLTQSLVLATFPARSAPQSTPGWSLASATIRPTH